MIALKVSADIYAYIEGTSLMDIIEKNKGLKAFVEQEMALMPEDARPQKCGSGCGGCCGHSSGASGSSCCGRDNEREDPAYLTAALMSLFNYYLPEDIKNALHLGGTAYLE